ncbi:MAG: hypothetical protein KAU50_08050 [Candidatus Marinimicrobia bacterium]|nr:hypothetical protein [Candidatus Neomarinimicrobiota bacterium]
MAKLPDRKSSKAKPVDPVAGKAKATKPPKPKKSGPSRFNVVFTKIRHNIYLAFLALLLIAVVGGMAAYVTYQVQRNVWEQRFHNENKEQLVDTRIDLLEKTVALMSKGFAVQSLEKADKKASLKALAKLGVNPTSIIDVISENLDRQTLAKCKFLESSSEYHAILKMDYIFFGDSTKGAIDALWDVKPWWSAGDKLREGLIDAMHYDFIEGFKP